MKIGLISVLVCAVFSASSTFAECNLPEVPSFPHGIEATAEEMAQARVFYSRFSAAIEDYKNCLNNDLGKGVITSSEMNKLLSKSGSVAETVERYYQEQVRVFESR